MSILINGMSLPSSCANCEWSRASKMDLGMSCCCWIAKKSGSMDAAKKGRLSFCPLIEVPNQHGRLIDGDRAVEALNFDYAYAAAKLIEGMPTIIEAVEEI